MLRPNSQSNQFQQGPNFNRGDAGFRSPMPMPRSRYQSPPRFHQQYVPYFSGPGGTPPPFPSPRGGGCRSPAGSPMRDTFSSPPMYGGYSQQQMMSPGPRFRAQMNTSLGSPSPFFNNMNRSSGSGTPDSFLSTPSTGSERSGGRGGRFGHKNSPFRDNGDIRQYFSMSMLSDPWENLTPVCDTSLSGGDVR
ncbi:hypothetical protein NP493_1217g00080 [Ridgeia piscesae]|uniref:M-phase-specific PLK1-interacting protein n=1 Tax=Ridgeia piscesae TaxID=27915 RepID=A0AAD9NHM1_RIDPI|nr:hypothetical protein NP493_1217g00080 [Ridgeia piscesae]